MTDHELMNEIPDRDQAEAAYLEEQMRTPGTLLHDATMLQFRSIRALIDTQQSLLNRLADATFSEISLHRDQLCTMDSSIISLQSEVAGLRIQLERLHTELAITQQHLNEMQQWKDSTHAFLVEPALKEERDAWEEKMREGMV